jgi:hypothetical protein
MKAMGHTRIGVLLGILVGLACWATLLDRADAQYRCAVTIDLKGTAVLQGTIRDVERPPTEQLWDTLRTLSFQPTRDGKGLPDPKSVERTMLNGEIRVRVNGAGEVSLKEISLVRNKRNTSAWVIAPDDVEQILKLRRSSGKEPPKKQ